MSRFTVPGEDVSDEYAYDSIPEVVNGDEMCVKLSAWLGRCPATPLAGRDDDDGLDLFWHRNVYPDLQALANGMHERGVLGAGEYGIDVTY